MKIRGRGATVKGDTPFAESQFLRFLKNGIRGDGKLKNVIVLDAKKGAAPELILVSSPQNTIWFRVLNPDDNAKLMIFYGSAYQCTISGLLHSQDIQIPTAYVSDAEMIHIKYVGAAMQTNIHILGNEAVHKNLILSRKEKNIYFCAGTGEKEADIESIESIYLKKLAKLISATTLPVVKCCYDDLVNIEKRFNEQLIRLGGDGGETVNGSVRKLEDIEIMQPSPSQEKSQIVAEIHIGGTVITRKVNCTSEVEVKEEENAD
ncbi:MAG: hypothetical protein MSA76_08530 [Clostridium sp.]|nr:hypothetical protein [Clostridium sp.]